MLICPRNFSLTALFSNDFEDPSQPLRVPRNQQEADEMMAATLRNAANRPLNLQEVRLPCSDEPERELASV